MPLRRGSSDGLDLAAAVLRRLKVEGAIQAWVRREQARQNPTYSGSYGTD